MKISQESFMDLYDQHVDAIFRHCYYRVGDKETAKDLVQDTFLKAWDYLDSGKEVTQGKAFLYKVATNLIIDRSRKKRESSIEGLQELGIDPMTFREKTTTTVEERIDIQIASRKIFLVLDQLDKEEKEIILLRYIDEFAPREIAEFLEETPNVISVRLHRALQKAQQLMNQLYDGQI